MQKLIINKLGPIEQCELECTKFMALTGFQASGKSTIAKAIYYFKTIKEDIIELAKTQALQHNVENKVDLKKGLENHLREKFLRTFGSSWGMSNEMYIEYHFTDTCFVRISLKEEERYSSPNYIWVELSENLKQFLRKKNNFFNNTSLDIIEDRNSEIFKKYGVGVIGNLLRTTYIEEKNLEVFKKELYKIFDDSYSVVYIPAGRSMITLLSQQFAYIYATMDDMQKRSLDSCTKDYLERILRLKPEFSEGLEGLMAYYLANKQLSKKTLNLALFLIKNILRGAYRYVNGEEQIVLEDGKYIKLNFSSSGQQESVWILNLLCYYLLQENPILFIIEEPESNLFPESQKYITEMIALVSNCGHSVVLTTHSPYVLGTLNNLLYAHTIDKKYAKETDRIIPRELWLDDKQFNSWFVKNGMIENCMDSEIHMIENERIDEISKVINHDFDRMLNLQDEMESVVEECH